jgi:hypothetical protein
MTPVLSVETVRFGTMFEDDIVLHPAHQDAALSPRSCLVDSSDVSQTDHEYVEGAHLMHALHRVLSKVHVPGDMMLAMSNGRSMLHVHGKGDFMGLFDSLNENAVTLRSASGDEVSSKGIGWLSCRADLDGDHDCEVVVSRVGGELWIKGLGRILDLLDGPEGTELSVEDDEGECRDMFLSELMDERADGRGGATDPGEPEDEPAPHFLTAG